MKLETNLAKQSRSKGAKMPKITFLMFFYFFKFICYFTSVYLYSYTSAKWYSRKKNRHLVETACTLLLVANPPVHHWIDVILTTCYLINKIPFIVEPLFSISPRVFGCVFCTWCVSRFGQTFSLGYQMCLMIFSSSKRISMLFHWHKYYMSTSVTFF